MTLKQFAQNPRQRRIFARRHKQGIRAGKFAGKIFLVLAFIFLLTHANLFRPTLVTHKVTGVVSVSPRPSQTVQAKVVAKIPLRPQTDEGYIQALPHGDLVWKTYRHESGAGKYDACKPTGFNGFGYGQVKDGTYPCWPTLQAIATKVSDWFTLHLQYMTEDQALCYYNTGKLLDSCAYSEYNKSL